MAKILKYPTFSQIPEHVIDAAISITKQVCRACKGEGYKMIFTTPEKGMVTDCPDCRRGEFWQVEVRD